MPRYNAHYHHHGHHSHHSHQADTGVFLMFAGLLLGSPFLFILGYFEYMTAPMLMAASSTTLLGLSTLSLSALIVYGSIGVTYMFSGARECYSSDQGPLDLLKSRVTNNGLVSTLGAILWSPFLLVGGVAGATAKAVVNVFSSKSSSEGNDSSSTTCSSEDDEESEEEDDIEYPQPPFVSQEKKAADTPLHSSTESVTQSGEQIPPTTNVGLPISKSQENLASYNKLISGLNVKPSSSQDDSRIDQVPVTSPRLLRQESPQVVLTQEQDQQKETRVLQ